MELDNTNYEDMLLNHHLPPFTNYKDLTNNGIRIISKASGNYIYDESGNKILDAMAGLWCVNIGYGRHRLAEVAKEQMLKLPYYNSFFKTNNVEAATLSMPSSRIFSSSHDAAVSENKSVD